MSFQVSLDVYKSVQAHRVLCGPSMPALCRVSGSSFSCTSVKNLDPKTLKPWPVYIFSLFSAGWSQWLSTRLVISERFCSSSPERLATPRAVV